MVKKEDKDIQTLDQIKGKADPDIEILALRSQVQNAKAEIRLLQKNYGDLRGYFRDVSDAAQELILEPPKRIYTQPKMKMKVESPCIAVLHTTDWHYGATIDPEEVEFMSEFSPEICEDRILDKLIPGFVNWVDVLRSGYLINECVILDTGDNISGDIHRELSITNAFPSPVQAVRCGALKAAMVKALIPHFEKIRVEYVVPDNHGRLTRKPGARQSGLNTHNYTVAHFGKLILGQQENVEFNIHISHNKVVQVSTRQYLITHGHDVQGWAGFPYYGIDRKVSREALVRMNEADFRKFHKVIIGHWHTPLAHPWYWIGGSVSGTDAYDYKQGRNSNPIQVGWIVHPKRGEFNRTEFLLN